MRRSTSRAKRQTTKADPANTGQPVSKQAPHASGASVADHATIGASEPANDSNPDTPKKGGRPTLAPHQIKAKSSLVKMTGTEYANIRRNADKAGMPVATYLRTAGLRRRIVVRKTTSALSTDPSIVLQGQRIGVNLNQIAHQLNAALGYVPHELEDALREHKEWMDRIYGRGEKS